MQSPVLVPTTLPDLSAVASGLTPSHVKAAILRTIPMLKGLSIPAPKRTSGVAVQNRLAKKARNIRKNKIMHRGVK